LRHLIVIFNRRIALALARQQLPAVSPGDDLHRIDTCAEFQEQKDRRENNDTGKSAAPRHADAGPARKTEAAAPSDTAGKPAATLAALIFHIVTLPAALPTHFPSPNYPTGTIADTLYSPQYNAIFVSRT
jgi:hypothetical protein